MESGCSVEILLASYSRRPGSFTAKVALGNSLIPVITMESVGTAKKSEGEAQVGFAAVALTSLEHWGQQRSSGGNSQKG